MYKNTGNPKKKPIVSKKKQTENKKIEFSANYIGWDDKPISFEQSNEKVPSNPESIESKPDFKKVDSYEKIEQKEPPKNLATSFQMVERPEMPESKPEYRIDYEEVKEHLGILIQTQNFLSLEREVSWKKVKKGMINLGASCYINCALQILLSIKEFVNHLLKLRFNHTAWLTETEENSALLKKSIFMELIEIIFGFEYESTEPLNISGFKKSLDNAFEQFRGTVQSDTHEFLLILFSVLEEVSSVELKIEPESIIQNYLNYKENNPCLRFFSGIIEINKKNTETNKSDSSQELFYALSLPIPQREEEKMVEMILIPYSLQSPILKAKSRVTINQTFSEALLEIFNLNPLNYLFSRYLIFLGTEQIIQNRIDPEKDCLWQISNEAQLTKKQILVYEIPDISAENEQIEKECFIFVHFASEKVNKNLMGIKVKANLAYSSILHFEKRIETKYDIFKKIHEKFGDNIGLEIEEILEEKKEIIENPHDSKENPKEETIIIKTTKFKFSAKLKFLKNIQGNYCCGICQKKACDKCEISFDKDESLDQGLVENLELEIFYEDKEVPEIIANYCKGVIPASIKGLLGPASLEQCLDCLFKPETVNVKSETDVDNEESNTITLSSRIIEYPEYLFLHLKRFKNSQTKIESIVNFPFCLSYFEPFSKYSLFGVINHEGEFSKGHYFSYIKEGKQWTEYNDPIFRAVENVESRLAYILVYKRELISQ